MDSLLVAVGPLVDLLSRADQPAVFAEQLLQAALASGGNSASEVRLAEQVWQVCESHARDLELVAPVLACAQVIEAPTADAALTAVAALRVAQAQAILADRRDDNWHLVLTIPGFLRGRFDALAGGGARPRETSSVLTDVAASATRRLIIAAPYLHTGFIEFLVEPVRRLLGGGGEVVVLTRALSLRSPQTSSANVEAVEQLRAAAAAVPGASAPAGLLRVCSWEEHGLGLHFKAVVADGRRAYLGSSNFTPGGTAGHAEGGVLLDSSRVTILEAWLRAVADELDERRLPHA